MNTALSLLLKRQVDVLQVTHRRVTSPILSHLSSSSSVWNDKESKQTTVLVEHDEELQPHWKSMESRVLNRGIGLKGKTSINLSGRGRVPPTDEEYWVESGIYNCIVACQRYQAGKIVVCDDSCNKNSTKNKTW